MALQFLSVTLQVWQYSGRPDLSEFLDRLAIDSDDDVKTRTTPNPRVDITEIEVSEFSDAEEPSEAFVAELDSRLNKAAHWLQKQPSNLFANLRDSGYYTELLFNGWIDCDQLDLYLPPALLEICGKLGLRISIITND